MSSSAQPLEGPGPEVTERSRPTRLPQGLSVLIGLACLLIIAQNTRDLQSILAAAFMALNLVIVVWPIQRRLARVIPGVLASLVAGLTAAAILVGFIYALGWAITRLIRELPHYSGQFQNMIDRIVGFADRHGVDTATLIDQIQNINLSTIVSALSSIASNISSAIALIALIIMILIFMIMDSTGFPDRMARLAERHNPALAQALITFARGARRYWVMSTVFGLAVAGVDLVLLTVLGVPLALVWFLFSFVTNYIPTVGLLIGLIPQVIMALLANGPATALWVAIGYSLTHLTLQGFVNPRVTGHTVGITATVTFLSLLIWAYVLGPLGALLAVPATLLVKALFIDMDPQTRWVNALIASDPDS